MNQEAGPIATEANPVKAEEALGDETEEKPTSQQLTCDATETTDTVNSAQASGSVNSDSHPATGVVKYANLDREVCYEQFKIKIGNLPKFYGCGELKKLLTDTLQLSCSKVKPPWRGCPSGFACFRSEEDRTKALEILNGYVWKKSTLSAKPADAAPDPYVAKRARMEKQKNSGKRRKFDDDENLSQEERLKKSTAPLWNKNMKREDMKKLLLQLGNDLLEANSDLSEWLKEQREKNDGLPCPLLDIRSSSVIDGYRNKCEFSIGLNPETNKVTVGFRLGSYADGSVSVAAVDGLPHVPDRMKLVAKAMENFIEESGYPPFDHVTHKGFWRQITVRIGTATGELLLVAGMHPQDLKDDELQHVKEKFVKYFSEGPGSNCNVNSLHFLSMGVRQQGSKSPSCEHLWGQTHIHDILLGFKFRISPEAFFQVNTLACEELYKAVAEVANLSEDTALLDVCCGAGTIGLCLSKQCGQILGVELVEQAVKDAEFNAESNGVKNCAFFAGRAEDILSGVIDRATQKELIAVVDPPRAGLHQKAISTLRSTRRIEKLVYLSCDPKAALKNFVELGKPPSKSMRGLSMVPVKAIPVDLFPHTKLCELVIYFERIDTRLPEERYQPE
ncbi:tRNA (uracil-5-)-methyltransferase-like protein A [Frankliniella fusca]|uniref:tRNA (uracil(54)-C(5))-methyltransferase n=1 Tax=Frankliniella fusca TaxID=407009 RepID=A0AAE1LGR1_9NEOP|nr:tRNA (uracil-5-)-methyltransferase-like protein A [Frankliniella fusca]